MTHALRQAAFLKEFECLGADCPDTCCQGWNMQLGPATRELYARSAPELLDAVVEDGDGGLIMKRDGITDFCVRFEDGVCGIHRKFGTDFLGDACHFYPRVTRRLGDAVLMTAIPSCPEAARLALYGEQPFALENAVSDRLPFTLKDYLPEGLPSAQALMIHEAFIAAAGDTAASAEHNFIRIANAAHALESMPVAQWAEAVPFFLQTADGRLPPAEPKHEDPFNLLHALCGMMVAAHKKKSPRLMETIAAMERGLHAEIHWESIGITTHDDSLAHYLRLRGLWEQRHAAAHADVLRRWLQMQMSVALFPFAGLGETLSERITIIGVRFATFRLALLCESGLLGGALPQEAVVRVAQSLARVLDHLADPAFSLQVYKETGWSGEGRMRGLLGA